MLGRQAAGSGSKDARGVPKGPGDPLRVESSQMPGPDPLHNSWPKGLKTPDITLYFLQASRSIRIAWLLEELGIDYKLHNWDRESSGLAPADFKQSCGALLGRAPVLKDGPLTLQESGAITECAPPE